MLSTPSKNRTASRSQSQNMQNTVGELKEDLVVDVRRSQPCDLDELLKYYLYSVLEEKSQEKKDLDGYQKRIEKLERELDADLRARDAERSKQSAENQAEGAPTPGEGSNQSDPEITQWQNELDKLRTERQKILDRLFDKCLEIVLPICEDIELRSHLTQYSQAGAEVELYRPFVNLSNRALDRMKNLPLDTFKATSSLNCRLHLNDPMVIRTDYEGSSVNTKPDVIITSTVAARDVNHDSNSNPADPVYTEPPKNGFKMRQTLCSGEFKKRNNSLTAPLTSYGKTRRSEYGCGDNELSAIYSLDESAPAVDASSIEAGEPSTKRTKMDPSEPTMTSSGTGAGPSKTRDQSANKATTSKATSKTSKTKSNKETTYYPPENSKKMVDARTQCAVYGTEMLSYAIGVHHAITFLIIDCKLWVWYYDRQGVIQSNGIDFVEDLPRFLVLLFAFQRFDLAEWGVIVELNPGAVLAHNETATPMRDNRRSTRALNDAWLERGREPATCTLEAKDLDAESLGGQHLGKIQIDLKDWLSHKPHCLGGRATAVLGSSVPDDARHNKLACKISFPEISRENEGRIIEGLRQEIGEEGETKQLSKHLPEVLMYGDMSRYGTQRIRSMLKLSIGGCRTLRALVSRKLAPLTSLVGAEFVKAWLEVVKFHAFLWSRNTEHGDPSLWNVMYNEDLKCGVLSDYDLSISRRQPRVPGTDRTGTIPFMAVDLLTHKYWRGEVERLYRHELEALIWILPFVFLRYQNGESQRGTPVDKWMTSDYVACAERKNYFLKIDVLLENGPLCQADFKDHWILAEYLLHWWNTWLTSIKGTAYMRNLMGARTSDKDDSSVASVWPLFVSQLRSVASKFSSHLGYIDKLVDDLGLERPFWVQQVPSKA